MGGDERDFVWDEMFFDEFVAADETVFFAVESEEKNWKGRGMAGESGAATEHGRKSAGVIVRARAAGNRIVVGADEDVGITIKSRIRIRGLGEEVIGQALGLDFVAEG
jgi:hypothetical protein